MRILISLLVLFVVGHAYAQPVMIKDINLGNLGSGGDPRIIIAGNTIFFIADDGIHGKELWKTDGTEQGTQLVADIAVPDPLGMYESIAIMSSIGGVALFMMDDGIHGRELWRSDGTTQGTYLLKDIQPGKNSSLFGSNLFVRVKDKMFFYVSGGLWMTDGTVVGTVPVKDINNAMSEPGRMTSFNDLLYFSASDKKTGNELWRSDGTSTGTYLVKDIWNGRGNSDLSEMAVVGGYLYFAANDSLNGQELWRSDGTTLGTELIKDIYPGTNSSNIKSLTTVGNVLYFTARTPQYGQELWKSDGTPGGTVLVKDILSNTRSSDPSDFISMNGKLYFTARDSMDFNEVWESDGTAVGTIKHGFLNRANIKQVEAYGRFVFQNKFYLNVNDSVHGWELWSSDGTSQGTGMLKDINPGEGSGVAGLSAVLNGNIYFWAYDGFNGVEIWKSDGTGSGTKLLKNINTNGSGSEIDKLTVSKGLVYFTANDQEYGNELWRSDGSKTGTFMVKDIEPGFKGAVIEELEDVSGTLYFVVRIPDEDGNDPYELWKTNGTEAGTSKLKTFSSYISQLTSSAGKLYFQAWDSLLGMELWKSDGTLQETQVLDIKPGGESSYPYSLTDVNGVLFFVTNDNLLDNSTLWRTDGTVSGTKTMNTGKYFDNFTNLNGNLIYTGTSGQEQGLWISPGKLGSTELIKQENANFNNIGGLKSIDGYLYFSASSPLNGSEFWRSDATESGTKMVKDLFPGMTGSGPGLFTESDSGFYFFASRGAAGMDIWKSDGSNAKTLLVKQLDHLYFNFTPACIRNTLYFAWSDTTKTNGVELWRSDGTANGTHILDDLYTGPFSSNPRLLTVMNEELFFVATNAANGEELWKLDKPSSIEDVRVLKKDQLGLYPNPANDHLYIKYQSCETCIVQIVDMKGQVVYARNHSGAVLDISAFPSGIYAVNMIENGKYRTGKLVIMR
jgi:ELWxxDGT repeat protein